MAQKQTLQQFGQSIKAKHPEYKDMDDAALGKAVLAKYPQYADMVSDDAAPTPDPSGRTPTGEPAPGDTRNGFQRTLDNLVTPDPRREEWQSPLKNDLDTLARGSGESFLPLISHPIDSLVGAGKTAMDAIAHGNGPQGIAEELARPVVESAVRNYQQEGPVRGTLHTVGNLIGGAATGELGAGAAGEILPPIGRGFQSGSGTINDALIGTPSKAARFGAEPGLQLAKEGISGSSPSRLSSLIQQRIPEATAAHRAVVAAAPPGTTINAGPLLSQPFNDAVAGAADPVTGAGGSAPIRAALRTQRELTNVTDPNTGNITPMMRNPNMSPLDATNLKSNIYGRINYDNPSKMGLSNTGLKGAAHGLKDAVEQAVPDSIEPGQRLHNLMAAKDVVEPAARSQMLPTSKSGLLDRVVMGTGTNAAKMGYGAGDLLQSPATVGAGRAGSLVQWLRNQQNDQGAQ
jgi:hypothetical protein